MKRVFLCAVFVSILLAACSGANVSLSPSTGRSKEAMDYLYRATTEYDNGCIDSAMENLERAHLLFTLADDRKGVAMCMNNMGNVYLATGEFEDAVALFDEAFAIYSGVGDTPGALQALANKAAALTKAGRLDAASAALDDAERFAPAESKKHAPILNNRGVVLTKMERYEDAQIVLQKALSCVDPARPGLVATVNASLGHLMEKMGNHEKALEYFTRAYQADLEAGNPKGLADDLAQMAECAIQLGDYARGIEWLKRSTSMYALTGEVILANQGLERLVALAEEKGIDITVTAHFVRQWLKKGAKNILCR